MAKPGPAPKPFELKVLEGNRGHRPLDAAGTFRPEAGTPVAPAWLSPQAKKSWKRLSDELAPYNLLARVDQDAFAALCTTIGRLELFERAMVGRQDLMAAAGRPVTDAYIDTTPNGFQVQSALYQILKKEQADMLKQLESFGLRPDARAAVSTALRAQLPLFDANAQGQPAKDSFHAI